MAQTEPKHIEESIIYNYRVFIYCVTMVFRWNLINNEVKYMEDEKILRPKDKVHWSFKPNSMFCVSESLRATFLIFFTVLNRNESMFWSPYNIYKLVRFYVNIRQIF
jgi:Na+/H+ antiporter NhaB